MVGVGLVPAERGGGEEEGTAWSNTMVGKNKPSAVLQIPWSPLPWAMVAGLLLLAPAVAALVAQAALPHRPALAAVQLPAAAAVTAVAQDASPSAEEERQGRLLLSTLAAAGAAETGFLSWQKLTGGSAVESFCAAGGGCADVLNGPWATVSGVPLALFGLVAYSSMGVLAAWPLLAPDASTAADAPARKALVGGSAAMAAFSGCLMLLLLLVLREECVFCIASALLSTGMFAVAWRARLVPERTEAAVVAAGAALLSLAAAGALYSVQTAAISDLGGAAAPAAAASGLRRPPPIRSPSSARALLLADQLAARGARFYGAWWCSHCADQKETLGREAFGKLSYYECAEDGANSQSALCRAEDIKGYPTWKIDGEYYAGEKDLDELEKLLAKGK